jgi:hypothetical protein
VNGQSRSIFSVLQDPQLSPVISDEGTIPDLQEFMKRTASEMPCGEPAPRLAF